MTTLRRLSRFWVKLLLRLLQPRVVPVIGEARTVSAVIPLLPLSKLWARWQQPQPGIPSDERLMTVFVAAGDEATRRGAEAVGSEHLLWSVLTKAQGRFLEALQEVAGEPSSVLARLDLRLGERGGRRTGRLPQTREFMMLLDKAMEESKKRSQGVTVPAVLLLVICQDRSSGAASLLADLGVDLDRLEEGMNAYLNGIRST